MTEATAFPSAMLRSTQSTAATTTPGSTAAANSNSASSTTGTTSSTNSNTALGENDFLTLLTTQLQNQDPLNPMDDTQSVAELAQFSSLQATTNMATNFADFESNFAVSQASGLLGDKVTVATTDSTGNSSTVSGTVKSIQVVNGTPEFTMVDSSGNAIVDSNGSPIEFTTSQITAISQ
ncbi:MAG: flagellar hook capping FlgD N-terminal domain-containing protein [Candidatus Velthaea sp.]